MAQVRYLADNDLRDAIVGGLYRREPSIEFVRLRELGLGRLEDAEVLEWAAEQDFIVVSHDVNTMSAEASRRIIDGRKMSGLLLVQQNQAILPVIESLLLIWSATEFEDWNDVIEFIPI